MAAVASRLAAEGLGGQVQRVEGALKLADTCKASMDVFRRDDPQRFYQLYGVPADKQNDDDWFDPQHLREV